MTTDTVLLVTASYDQSAQPVLDHLHSMGASVFRLDTDHFPTKVKAHFAPRYGLVLKHGEIGFMGIRLSLFGTGAM